MLSSKISQGFTNFYACSITIQAFINCASKIEKNKMAFSVFPFLFSTVMPKRVPLREGTTVCFTISNYFTDHISHYPYTFSTHSEALGIDTSDEVICYLCSNFS